MTTDSQYLRKGITEWLPAWKARGWKTADRKPVKNVDLWQRLEAAIAPHRVEWHWVRGHAGHPENERADALARRGIDEVRGTARRAPSARDMICRLGRRWEERREGEEWDRT